MQLVEGLSDTEKSEGGWTNTEVCSNCDVIHLMILPIWVNSNRKLDTISGTLLPMIIYIGAALYPTWTSNMKAI